MAPSVIGAGPVGFCSAAAVLPGESPSGCLPQDKANALKTAITMLHTIPNWIRALSFIDSYLSPPAALKRGPARPAYNDGTSGAGSSSPFGRRRNKWQTSIGQRDQRQQPKTSQVCRSMLHSPRRRTFDRLLFVRETDLTLNGACRKIRLYSYFHCVMCVFGTGSTCATEAQKPPPFGGKR